VSANQRSVKEDLFMTCLAESSASARR
jgi:hypothetical protein